MSEQERVMFARIFSGGLNGVDAYCIEVECDCGPGIGQISLVGLPDASVKESQDRVRSAIKACDFYVPYAKRWIVNLAPADTKKEGPAFDLPIAVGILASTNMLPTEHLSKFWIVGELGLDGSVRPVSGVLPIAIAAKNYGAMGIILPQENAEEAALIDGLKVFPVSHLKQVCQLLEDPKSGAVLEADPRGAFRANQLKIKAGPDFYDVKGQASAKRALEIAAAGKHNILMVGPPGSGKSMLAQRLPGIMPPLSFDEALEVTKLYSVAGMLQNKTSLVLDRPFRSPHHSATAVGLVGGGAHPRPGEISLSHLGILFLDELTEFPRSHLETLRQPLETASVTISRALQTLTFPASFLLVGACNPCPCGYRGDSVKYCSCTPYQAERYWRRLSGPLLDRIDLHVSVARLQEAELSSTGSAEGSEDIRLRVIRAVEIQKERCGKNRFVFNGQMGQKQMVKHCKIDESSRLMLARAVNSLGLSARAYDRVLRIARTIADLNAHDDIAPLDLAEAIRYRTSVRPSL
jgi:magnesium chelatase family protein